MDDILSSLSGVSVTAHENNPYAEHPHYALYKAKPTGSSQQERRNAVLNARKEARYDILSHLRSVEELNEPENLDDNMECEEVRACYKRPRRYRNFLMLSEWLVDVPEDFAKTYVAVPCPVGKRSLVVAARGRTRAFTKAGHMVQQFPSMLPGGNHHTSRKGYALLDCIWSKASNTFYVLDLVVWFNQSVMESDTIFRFEWLKSRLLENTPDVQDVGRLNPHRFEWLPYFDCSPETLTKMLSEPLPFPVPLDGVLFYHRDTHYTHGPTPLVGWLKSYMFPEILNVPVPESVLSEMPAKYISLPSHIQHAKDKKKNRTEKMECCSSTKNKKTKPKTGTEEPEMEVTAT